VEDKKEKKHNLVKVMIVLVVLVLIGLGVGFAFKFLSINSEKKTITESIKGYVAGVVTDVSENNYNFNELNTVYAIPVECMPEVSEEVKPFGKWHQANEDYFAYVLVQYNVSKVGYIYGFTFKDSEGYGMYPVIQEKINESGNQIEKNLGLNQPKTGSYTSLTKKENWKNSGFVVNDETQIVVLKSVGDDEIADGKTTCNIVQKGDNAKDIEKEEKKLAENVLYGDVNLDKKVTQEDAEDITNYIAGKKKFSDQSLKNGDVNLDGKVNTTDARMVLLYVSGTIEFLGVNDKNTVSNIVGDINLDNQITQEDVDLLYDHTSGNNVINSQSLKNADVNGDGKVNVRDSLLLYLYINGRIDDFPVSLLGDMNLDGRLTSIDSDLLYKHVSGENVLDGQSLKNADVNIDSKVDMSDALMLKQIVESQESKLIGDIDTDGKLTDMDVNLLYSHVSGSTPLTGDALKNADVNGDNIVDMRDVSFLKKNIAEDEEVSSLVGDVNLDGKITKEDTNLLYEHASGASLLTGQALKNADSDKDGKVDMRDAFWLMKQVGYVSVSNLKGDVTLDSKLNQEDVDLLFAYVSGSKVLSGEALKNADYDGDGIVNVKDALQLQKQVGIKVESKLSGDVTLDSRINQTDVDLLYVHVSGKTTLTGQAFKNADYDGDGKVNMRDVLQLQKRVGVKAESTLLGDVNLDGKLTKADADLLYSHVSGSKTLTGQALKNADYNKDGIVDMKDALALSNKVEVKTESTLLGDVNLDGKLTKEDVDLLYSHVSGSKTLTGQALKNADYNKDGIVDMKDVSVLKKVIFTDSGVNSSVGNTFGTDNLVNSVVNKFSFIEIIIAIITLGGIGLLIYMTFKFVTAE